MSQVRQSRILVVEDRDSLRRLIRRALEGEGYSVTPCADVKAARQALLEAHDLVITDLKLPDGSGLDVLRESRKLLPSTPVVVLTAYGSVGTAVEAMKEGAFDFLEKPLELSELFQKVEGWLGGTEVEEGLDLENGIKIVGRHPRLRSALRLLERVAATDSTVLLTGESGTGKELFARGIHLLSRRREGPFVAVNCAAIPESLIENELFGHEKGAFTGAGRRQAGRFEQAGGGTLLLDEIGELPLALQAKVLRVLEERTYERIGGTKTEVADVRLVAATNRDLEAMVEAGTFRSDLYFRLDVFPIELPALRDRASDIPAIARHLLERISGRHDRPAPILTEGASELLKARDWPGNIRQLANVLERAAILVDGPKLRATDLEDLLQPVETKSERERVREALVATAGDKKAAAAQLGVSYRTLMRRIKEFDLEGVPQYRSGLP